MKDIKCPSCGKTFRIDPSSFEEILLQIKDEEFNKQIKERLLLVEEDNKKALEILKRELKIQLIEQNSIKETEIQALESKLKLAEEKKANALNDLRNQATNKINSLNNELIKIKDEFKNQSLISELSLKNKINEAVTNLERENSSLTNCIEKMKLEQSINEKLIEEKFKSKISERDLTIQELREMKSKLSTKMIGETLEIHCETQFNLNRASAFKNSYFEKDNDVTSGSKGDYIFREIDENRTEVISIMFEMKNESETGTNKRKNEDFLKELDKDRRQKSCEYAVLVSLLEPDSELYNAGIVDVSHRYPKMYVIRPQFFLPIISLLRNASMESLKYKSQIDLMKRENYDITNFESTLEKFKNAFGKNVTLAQDRFNDAISEIDKSITHLQKTKEALILSKKHLLTAGSKSQDLTVKKLTRNNPTMKKKFNDLHNVEDDVA
ncbi:DUF2130 domain-containing protein [Prochlorococcus marinus str. MU1404]|uniref:DUF2130 domain-containing protein n=1 Tax=Prochlorococcus marinus TaxID=1219 RepID=UPI001ADAA08D|nr:DUF2130 domain-containing protein [Prochlorococcus marinus]MBO8229956.1 DUF2130 domain-containing protein [Prochlorococcus marinus XMU1404]MBW3073268.1 DUF2130 domain-containing protein [Prochlorococcus marinus str. MU1404]MCR8545708.1 DUF2130 domain-containing protein [Prochlorococcus marinus CUG1432]